MKRVQSNGKERLNIGNCASKHSEAWLNNEIRNFNSNGVFPEHINSVPEHMEYIDKSYVKLPRVNLNNANYKMKNTSKISAISHGTVNDAQKKHSPFLWLN